jgi:hypothetical protein
VLLSLPLDGCAKAALTVSTLPGLSVTVVLLPMRVTLAELGWTTGQGHEARSYLAQGKGRGWRGRCRQPFAWVRAAAVELTCCCQCRS